MRAFEQPTPYFLSLCSDEDVHNLRTDYVPELDFVVVFNRHQPKHLLVKAFRELLSDQKHSPHPGKRGGSKKKEDLAVAFELLPQRRNWRACVTALDVLLEKLQNPEMPDWEVGKECRVGLIGVKDPSSFEKASLSSAVSRYLRSARALLRGVEEGIFPAQLGDLTKRGLSTGWERKKPLPPDLAKLAMKL